MLSMGWEHGARTMLGHGAFGAAVACVGLFLAELLSRLAARLGHETRTLALLGGHAPSPLRPLAEVTATALLAIALARPAGAATTPVRDWLSQTTSLTTAAPVPVAPPVPSTTTSTVPTPSSSSTSLTSTTTAGGSTPPAPAAPTPAPAPAAGVGAAPPSVDSLTPRAPTTTYVVRPGDCLWRIAARVLGPGATNRAVDAGWRAIYAENRASIGADPGLIHPGLVLTLPPLAATR